MTLKGRILLAARGGTRFEVPAGVGIATGVEAELEDEKREGSHEDKKEEGGGREAVGAACSGWCNCAFSPPLCRPSPLPDSLATTLASTMERVCDHARSTQHPGMEFVTLTEGSSVKWGRDALS
jgi:hypothetical protein